MATESNPQHKKDDSNVEESLDSTTDIEIVKYSLNRIRAGLGINPRIEIFPYRIFLTDDKGNPIKVEGHEGNYFLALTGFELNDRRMRDVNKDPLISYSAIGAGIVVPEIDSGKIYGQMIPTKATDSRLLSNRVVNVKPMPYGNFSRGLRLQLERSSAYRSDVPDELSGLIRRGAIVGLETLLPEALLEVAKDYKR
jgi:hypothetical protein